MKWPANAQRPNVDAESGLTSQNIQGQEGKRIENDEQTKIGPAINAEAVSAVTHRLEITEGRNPAHTTVEKEHGAKEFCGKGHLRNERV